MDTPELFCNLMTTNYITCMESSERFAQIKSILEKGDIEYLIPFFFMLQMEGKPFSLRNHFQFEPVYRLQRPKKFCLMCARQVGKTFSLCSSNLLLSWIINGYRSLFVLPRAEQAKRLSNDCMRLLINNSPFKPVFVKPGCDETVLFRSYANNSVQYFQYAFLDPDRIRGVSAISDLTYDESYCLGTNILCISEDNKLVNIPIEKINSDTLLVSFANDGYIIPSVTNGAHYHGVRDCYKIVLKDGRSVTGTIDHPIPTSLGWLTAGDIIEYASTGTIERIQRRANTDGNGNIAGGRLCIQNSKRESRVCLKPRVEAESVQLQKIPDITAVYSKSSKKESERRIWRLFVLLDNKKLSDICLYTHPVLSGREEDSNNGLVESVDPGGTSVVDTGRRLHADYYSQEYSNIDSFLHCTGSRAFNKIPKRQVRNRQYSAYVKKARERISGYSCNCKRHLQTNKFNSAIRLRRNEIQNRLEVATLPNLSQRNIRPGERLYSGMYRNTAERISTGLLSTEQTGNARKEQEVVCRTSGESERIKQSALLQESLRNQRKTQKVHSRIQKTKSGKSKREQAAFSRAAQKRARISAKTYGTAKTLLPKIEGRSGEICREAAEEQITREGIKAELVPISHIEYAGLKPVYDLTVTGTNTFFANEIAVHNCQDMNSDFMPVIDEVTSAVEKWGFKTFSGTPKTLDNTLTSLFEESSQAEWVTKCEHCNKFNIPSIDEDLMEMIGKSTCVCAKCKKALDCSTGTFVHRFPKRRQLFSGYHISQITHPLHYRSKEKWIDILYKMRTYPRAKFYNEILGVPCDFADKLVSQGELQSACSTEESEKNDLEIAIQRAKGLNFKVMGIDWGGGGSESQSYTAIAIGGTRPGQEVIEVVYGTKLNRNMPSLEQAQYILDLVKKFSPNFVAHDYGGAGVDKETILIQAGMPMDKLIPFTYIMSSQKPIIYYNPPEKGYRHSYSLDKMRSIVVLAHMLKARKIKFPTWESMTDIDTGLDIITLLEDFLHVNAERFERPRGSDVVLITKSPKRSDDFVHAVNYLCSCVWYTQQKYPNIAEAANMQLTAEDVAAFHPKQLETI